MTSYTDSPLTRQHSHSFDQGNPLGEKNAKLAMLLTLAMMVLEITAGYYFNSMALLADGWHMSSHALALGLSVSAYAAARKLANDRRFSFGTWKIEILAGYTSAICLLLVAALMAFESIQRLLSPAAIHYQQAIGVATLGLLVNLACAWLLKDGHHHHHGHEHHSDHHHGHDHAHGDLNLRSAYLHVIADAATSVMAIAALLGGMLLGLAWLDSVMGLVGSVMVAAWALGLLRDSSRVLLDAEMDAPVVEEVREAIAQGPHPVNITDLHVWRVGKSHYACIIAVEGAATVTPDHIRQLLSVHEELSHVSVEVNRTEPA
ncbi:MAG: CDF family Co(II)/Ni(II) efflux transporter DmeF [Comamonas sp.]|uniref:CDF family Co(II)/Ni(II) efflux transporter DmeF n=1 Tax=Comamonas TaxID=283 RepID=UPI002648D492|nr:CDF family Co(II)/Ni(II) efflux transporter DmeF [Comamonas sp.]MDN5504518.1 CDF family Co(II)/Ni(II) efflux transporter DmeF [Comamonas sp.]MDN5535627.1 CDF family Co(II)/Ni(II) efflux transporter DmeF [Comamonas sp.]